MVACREGQREVATILYHWNSAAATMRNNLGQTCAEVAGSSSCPELKAELQRLENSKKAALLESAAAAGRATKQQCAQFRKPGTVSTKVGRAPSLEGYLGVPGTARRSPSPLRSPSWRPASDSAKRKVRLKKRPSVDSGINVDTTHTRKHNKDVKQLSK